MKIDLFTAGKVSADNKIIIMRNDMKNVVKLYRHQTDGGAIYLCTRKVRGTKHEGDMASAVMRIDGKPEMSTELFDFYCRKEKLK